MTPIGIPDWGNVHLLCTDGRIKHVSDERIKKEALDNGGSDSVTVIIGRAVTPSGE